MRHAFTVVLIFEKRSLHETLLFASDPMGRTAIMVAQVRVAEHIEYKIQNWGQAVRLVALYINGA